MKIMGYGQHQSFYLRPHWLAKAIQMLRNDERFFYDKFGFEKIGLGKNMIKSLQFWTVAMNIAYTSRNEAQQTIHKLTEFADVLYQYDRFIRYPETAAILHYYLVSHPDPATTWYWFYNIVEDIVVSVNDLHTDLVKWVNQNEKKSVSDKSLRRDIDCLIKLYTAGKNEEDDPEEIIHSPLCNLKLIEINNNIIRKRSPKIKEIGLAALLYTLLDYSREKNIETISVDEIQNSPQLWGKVYNLKRNTIINALEELTHHPKYPIRFVRTNRLDSVHVPNVSPIEYLKFEYMRKKVLYNEYLI
jgi:hypothetical protein